MRYVLYEAAQRPLLLELLLFYYLYRPYSITSITPPDASREIAYYWLYY
jgi:hypothetical protein